MGSFNRFRNLPDLCGRILARGDTSQGTVFAVVTNLSILEEKSNTYSRSKSLNVMLFKSEVASPIVCYLFKRNIVNIMVVYLRNSEKNTLHTLIDLVDLD